MTRQKSNYMDNGIHVILPRRVSAYRHQYAGQFRPQPAYIELDFRGNVPTLSCSFDAEIGNAIPFALYNHFLVWWDIPPHSRLRDVRKVMRDIAPMCADLARTFRRDVDRNGNCIGRYDHDLSDRLGRIIRHATMRPETNPWL